MLSEYNIKKGQTLADVAVQETGWLEGIFDIARTNDIGITDDIAAGTLLDIDQELVNTSKLRLARLAAIEPATEFGYWISEGGEEPQLGGIGYMAVGIDFKVS